MGRRGPPPMPDEIANLRGKKRRGALPGATPKAKVGDPGIPVSLRGDKVAVECWKSLKKQLLQLKTLTTVDGMALEGLCRAYSRAIEADEHVAKLGLIVKTFNGVGPNPAVKISKESWQEVRKFAQEFGLTPSSRTRVRPAATEEEEGDELNTEKNAKSSAEGFLFGKRDAKIAGVIKRQA